MNNKQTNKKENTSSTLDTSRLLSLSPCFSCLLRSPVPVYLSSLFCLLTCPNTLPACTAWGGLLSLRLCLFLLFIYLVFVAYFVLSFLLLSFIICYIIIIYSYYFFVIFIGFVCFSLVFFLSV